MANWTLTDTAKAQIPEWNERWKRIITSTAPVDWNRAEEIIAGLYGAAGLETPRVVPVLSPMMGAVVWAASSVYWESASAATRAATAAETAAETAAATYAATAAATAAETDAATDDMLLVAASVVSQKLGRDVTQAVAERLSRWYGPYDGGCEWASWCCYLSFVRDVVGWQHESHVKYRHYELAATELGPRFAHKRFCLVSERAECRRVNDDGKLHCEFGPAIRWRCGTERFYLDGENVGKEAVEGKARQRGWKGDIQYEDSPVIADWLAEVKHDVAGSESMR